MFECSALYFHQPHSQHRPNSNTPSYCMYCCGNPTLLLIELYRNKNSPIKIACLPVWTPLEYYEETVFTITITVSRNKFYRTVRRFKSHAITVKRDAVFLSADTRPPIDRSATPIPCNKNRPRYGQHRCSGTQA